MAQPRAPARDTILRPLGPRRVAERGPSSGGGAADRDSHGLARRPRRARGAACFGLARLVERHGPAVEARATTRTLNVTDHLRLLARARLDEAGRPRLEPPGGGYLVTNLELDEAMRLLGGHNRRLVAASIVGLFVAVRLVAASARGAVAVAVLAA